MLHKTILPDKQSFYTDVTEAVETGRLAVLWCEAHPLVADWLQMEHVPEGHPALLVVEQLHSDVTLLLDGRPNLVHCPLIRLSPLEEPAVAPQDLFSGVLCQCQEVVGGEDLQQGTTQDQQTLQLGGCYCST